MRQHTILRCAHLTPLVYIFDDLPFLHFHYSSSLFHHSLTLALSFFSLCCYICTLHIDTRANKRVFGCSLVIVRKIRTNLAFNTKSNQRSRQDCTVPCRVRHARTMHCTLALTIYHYCLFRFSYYETGPASRASEMCLGFCGRHCNTAKMD